MADVAINPSINVNTNLDKIVEYVDKVVQRLDKMYSSTKKVEGAANQHLRVNAGLARGLQSTNTAMQTFNKSSQDLTKSVQVALGPLSGVAARITALTALFNRNTFAAAGMIGMFTGFVVATKRMVRLGTETELQMLRMDAVVRSLGDSAAFTSNELEGMAQSLAAGTLASVSEAREAVTTLATFGNIAPQIFEQATRSAYAFADVMGGQLAASVRQVGVLLEDPVRNMEMLRRRGIQFTQAEREKIDVLMRSGRVMEAQALTLKKFEIFVAQSEEKTKLLAGTLDRTSQLLQTFFESVNKAGGVTGSVSKNISILNDALETLLTNDTFIENLGRAFETAGRIVSRVLVLVTENIEALSAAIIGLVTLLTGKVLLSLAAFTVKIIAASKAINTLRTSILGLFLLFRVGGAAGVLGGVLAGGAALLTGKFLLLVAALTAATIAYKKFTSGASEETRRVNAEVTRLNEKLQGLPEDKRLEFQSNISVIGEEIKAAINEVERLEKILEEKSKRSFLPGTRAQRQSDIGQDHWTQQNAFTRMLFGVSAVSEDLDKANQKLDESSNKFRNQEAAIDAARQAWNRYRQDMSGVITSFEQLEESFFPELKDAREKAKNLEILKNMLEDIANVTDVGVALWFAGIDEERILRVMDAVERGRTTATRASESWKGLANTFEDLQFNVTNLIDELSGLDTSLRVPSSLMRQWNELTGGERTRLTGMGITPDTMTGLRNVEKEMNDLMRYRQRIIDEELSAREKVTQEADRMLSILEGTQGISQDILDIERKRIEAYRDSQVAEILKQEKRAHFQAVREIEDMYAFLNLSIKETFMDSVDFEIAKLDEGLRVKMHFIQEYANKVEDIYGEISEEHARMIDKMRADVIAQHDFEVFLAMEKADNLRKIAAGAAEAMQSAFADFLFKPWEEGLRGMLTSFVMTIHRMVSELLAQQLLLSFLGAMGGSAGGTNFWSTAFRAVAAAQGGYISGPGTSTSDSIPARLSAGEYVINARAVRQIGVNTLHAINEGRTARFSEGGYVGNQAEAGTAGVRIVNVIDPALVQDYMNSPGGEKVVLNILQKNAGNVRQLIT
jgi:hypothetical protein